MVSLSRRKGPELWISGVSSAWIGPALGTTALSNYDVRVVARVDGGGGGFLWVSDPDCGKAYVGQTGRDFASRYSEHKRAFRHNYHTSKFAEHLNDQLHSFGLIHEVMHILQFQKKSPHINTIERFYIHKEAASHTHLNDEHKITPNRMFDSVLKFTS